MKKLAVLQHCKGFDWDMANINKSWHKHGVTWQECEQVFFHRPILVRDDEKHSQDEQRFYALGRTDQSRRLMLVFTIREDFVRIISARDMSQKEKKIYEQL